MTEQFPQLPTCVLLFSGLPVVQVNWWSAFTTKVPRDCNCSLTNMVNVIASNPNVTALLIHPENSVSLGLAKYQGCGQV